MAQQSAVKCPKCQGPMQQRTSARGPFWGCRAFPRCRGTLNMASGGGGGAGRGKGYQRHQVAQVDPRQFILLGSAQQEAIFAQSRPRNQHGVIVARAGVGKTFVITQSVLRQPDRKTLGIAFNSHIRHELGRRFAEMGITWASAHSYHSLGRQSILARFPKCDLYQDKLDTIIGERFAHFGESRDEAEAEEQMTVLMAVTKLVRLCKSYLEDGRDERKVAELAERHSVECGDWASQIHAAVPWVLDQCLRRTATMDFDDMGGWWSVVMGLPVEQFDRAWVDEFQDTSVCQQELVIRTVRNGDLWVCGDSKQAIYGFRGALSGAFEMVKEKMAATGKPIIQLPITVSRRCPKKHIELARLLVPDIEALPDAPEGEVACLSGNLALDEMRPGDLVLCRVNAPLARIAYGLLRRGVKAIIRGKEIGDGLISLVKKLKGRSIEDLLQKMVRHREREGAKLEARYLHPVTRQMSKKGQEFLDALVDKCLCIESLCEGIETIDELKASIEKLFADFDDDGKPRDAVVCGSIHRTKGLEANTVYVADPSTLLMVRSGDQEWCILQEQNLVYIAVTRAKFEKDKDGRVTHPGRLVFMDMVPAIFADVVGPPPTEERVPVEVSGISGINPGGPEVSEFPESGVPESAVQVTSLGPLEGMVAEVLVAPFGGRKVVLGDFEEGGFNCQFLLDSGELGTNVWLRRPQLRCLGPWTRVSPRGSWPPEVGVGQDAPF